MKPQLALLAANAYQLLHIFKGYQTVVVRHGDVITWVAVTERVKGCAFGSCKVVKTFYAESPEAYLSRINNLES